MITTDSAARLSHPWLRIRRLFRVILETRWGADEWPIVKAELRNELKEQPTRTRCLVAVAKRATRPDTAKTLTVLPVQLRPGDTFTDDTGACEIIGQPRSERAGKNVVARVQRPGDPGTLREQWWQAYERVTVKRTAS